MNKLTALLLVLALLVLPCAALADKTSAGEYAAQQAAALSEDQRQVNVFTWVYYIPDEVVADFEAATGMRVNYTPFLDNEDILSKLSVDAGQFDIVVCSDYVVHDLVQMNLLEKIDYSLLPNAANIDPTYQNQYFDPESAYTIPYTNTVPVIVYNPDAVDFEIKGVADLWNPAFEGNLALIAEWRNVMGLAQKKLGLSFNETDAAKMAPVLDELNALKPNIAVMNDDTPHNALIHGDAIAGFMYGSHIAAAMEVMPQLKVVYPEEGMNFGIDSLMIPTQAPHAQAAHIFINYLLDGEVSAYASELINYGNLNTAAQAYLSEDYLNDTAVNVPAEALKNAEMMQPLSGETLDLYDSIWTEFMK